MPQFERIEKTRHRRKLRENEQAASTFPEDFVRPRATGGGPDDSDELLERIDQELQAVTARALGRAASTDQQ